MPQIYLLDTNAASDMMNGTSPALRRTLAEEGRTAVIAISSITSAELRFGIRLRDSIKLQRAFADFCMAAQILPWDDTVSVAYAELRLLLMQRGKALDAMDLLIASHAYALGATLVTRDNAFHNISGLVQVVNWAIDLRQPQ